jgi:hypothetical protein
MCDGAAEGKEKIPCGATPIPREEDGSRYRRFGRYVNEDLYAGMVFARRRSTKGRERAKRAVGKR